MPQIDIPARSARLRQAMTLENLYAVTTEDRGAVASRWLEDGREMQLSYAEYDGLVRDAGAYLRAVIGAEREGRFVAIQMETGPRWFSTFWGLIAAGYDEENIKTYPDRLSTFA